MFYLIYARNALMDTGLIESNTFIYVYLDNQIQIQSPVSLKLHFAFLYWKGETWRQFFFKADTSYYQIIKVILAPTVQYPLGLYPLFLTLTTNIFGSWTKLQADTVRSSISNGFIMLLMYDKCVV